MSISRPTIIQNLEQAFLKTPGLYEKCRATTKDRIEAGDFEGFFNDYPALLCPPDVKALRDRYMNILRGVNANSGHLFQPNEIVQKIEEFTFDIAILGFSELLDHNGELIRKLLDFLKLSNYADKLKGQGTAIVKSYLAMVVADINESAELYSNKYEAARGIVTNCIHRRCRGIIDKAMQYRDRGISLTRASSQADMVLNYAVEHPRETAIAVGVVALLGLFGGGAAIATAIAGAQPRGPKPF